LQLIKKFPTFHRTPKFITVLTSARKSISPMSNSQYFVFHGEELLAPRPTPKLEDHSLSAVRDCLFNLFRSCPPYRRPFLHPQPEDAPCRGDSDPQAVFVEMRVTVMVAFHKTDTCLVINSCCVWCHSYVPCSLYGSMIRWLFPVIYTVDVTLPRRRRRVIVSDE
jgi:hypothetical protein